MTVYLNSDDPEAFATGAVGEPGSRTFYLQVRADGESVTIKCEKQQVAELARHLRLLLEDLPDPGPAGPGDADLVEPATEDFVLGSIALGIDRSNARMLVQLEEMVVVDEEDFDDLAELLGDSPDIGTSTVRVLLTPAQVVAFCRAADAAVGAGRSLCMWCEDPMDPAGHVCPRFN